MFVCLFGCVNFIYTLEIVGHLSQGVNRDGVCGTKQSTVGFCQVDNCQAPSNSTDTIQICLFVGF